MTSLTRGEKRAPPYRSGQDGAGQSAEVQLQLGVSPPVGPDLEQSRKVLKIFAKSHGIVTLERNSDIVTSVASVILSHYSFILKRSLVTVVT